MLLLGFYHLVLEREKMHKFNRFYLLGSIIFSLLVPSFIITVPAAEFVEPIITETSFDSNISYSNSEITAVPIQEIDYTNYLISFYIVISAILFFLFGRKIYSLLLKIKQNKKVSYFKATFVLLKEQILPHTFLNYIFINKNEYQTDNLEQQILTHELTHVQQKHTLDVLFIKVMEILFWFNPIFRFYRKAIQLNHEFLADDAVINSHKNISEYQHLLVSKTAQNNNIYLASNFNYSLTKKRLLMMTTPSSKTKILLKKLLILPLIVGFIFAFAQRVEAQEKKKKKKPDVVEIQLEKRGLSREGMKEYQQLFNAGKDSKIYKRRDVSRMVTLYKAMSTKQQKSITDIRKVIPPPPPIDLVYTYNRLAKKIKASPKKKKANVQYLYSLYHKMNASQKKKVKKPSSIAPPPPKPVLIEVIEKDKRKTKQRKSKRKPKPVSIKVIEKADSKKLKEIIEEEEVVVEQHELREVKEGVEETEVVVDRIEPVEEVEVVEEVETPEVVEIIEEEKEFEVDNTKRIETLLKYIKSLKKKGAKFSYNKLPISYKKAKFLISKKGIYNIYAKEGKNKKINVILSDTPFVKKIVENKLEPTEEFKENSAQNQLNKYIKLSESFIGNKNRSNKEYNRIKKEFKLLTNKEKRIVMSPENILKNIDELEIKHKMMEKSKLNQKVYKIKSTN